MRAAASPAWLRSGLGQRGDPGGLCFLSQMPVTVGPYGQSQPSCFDRVKMGFMMGFAVGMAAGALFGTFSCLRYTEETGIMTAMVGEKRPRSGGGKGGAGLVLSVTSMTLCQWR